MADLLKLPKLSYFALGFAHGRRRRESLGDCFAFALMSQAQAGSVSRIIRLSAMTSRSSALTGN